MPTDHHDFILTLSCPDAKGVVFRVSEFLFAHQCNILDSAQFGDDETGLFFMRVHFDAPSAASAQSLSDQFQAVAQPLSMQWSISQAQKKAKTLILVSRHGQCLNDLLFRTANGALPIEIVGVASNHTDFKSLVEHHGLAFHHLPVTPSNKTEQEAALRQLAEASQVDLVVLARYMQILSPELCAAWSGRAINIHHSFLPSFKGAKPYAQAYARGVKIIGATSHYVTTDLDEGPIIEQDIERVDHTLDATELARIGGDIESRVLARAVLWHAERRILLNGSKTIVFR
jgi:formyltetrahydrofolate deformylase